MSAVRARLAALLLLCGGGCATLFAAEPPPDPDLSTEGTRRAGPFYLRPYLAIRDVGYDDNIFLESPEPVGDTTATIGPGLDALLLFGERGGLRLDQRYDYVAYGQYTELNHWNGDIRARGVMLAKRLVLSLEDHATSYEERPNYTVDQRLRNDSNAITAAFRTLRRGRLGVEGFLRHNGIDYSPLAGSSDASADRLDRDERTLSVTGTLRVRPKTSFLLEGRVERYDFVQDFEGRDSRSTAALVGLRFDPSASIQGELRIGTENLTAPERPESDYHGPIGEGHLMTRLGHAGRGRLSLGRDIVFSTIEEDLYFVNTFWAAAYEQFFSRRWSGLAGYGRSLAHYPEAITRVGTPPFQGIRDDRISEVELALRYRANEQLWIQARVRFWQRDSTDDFYDRDRTFYTIGSVYEF
jgi:hypothetical protein